MTRFSPFRLFVAGFLFGMLGPTATLTAQSVAGLSVFPAHAGMRERPNSRALKHSLFLCSTTISRIK